MELLTKTKGKIVVSDDRILKMNNTQNMHLQTAIQNHLSGFSPVKIQIFVF